MINVYQGGLVAKMKARILTILTASLISGCSYINPFIQEMNIISVEQEIEIGRQMRDEIANQMTLVEEPVVTGRVDTIGRKLIESLPRKDFDYNFFVVRDETPNAFTIPGGTIYVHTGLLNFVGDDSELAGVIGHEIGHAYERHPTKSLSRAYGMSYLAGLIVKGNENKLKQATAEILAGGVLNKYGREDEREADDIGYYLLRKSEYSSDGLLKFLKRLEKVSRAGATFDFLSTHPPTPERIARLEALEANREGAVVELKASGYHRVMP